MPECDTLYVLQTSPNSGRAMYAFSVPTYLSTEINFKNQTFTVIKLKKYKKFQKYNSQISNTV